MDYLNEEEVELEEHGKCTSAKSLCDRISNVVHETLEEIFKRVGIFVGIYPIWIIIVCFLINLAFLPGLLLYFEESTVLEESVVKNSHHSEARAFVDKYFPTNYTSNTVLVVADNVLDPDTFKQIWEFHMSILRINDASFEGICHRFINGDCLIRSLFEAWSYNDTTIQGLTAEDIAAGVEQLHISPVYEDLVETKDYLGHLEISGPKPVFRIKYFTDHKAGLPEWETAFRGKCASAVGTYSAFKEVYYDTNGMFDDEVESSSAADLILVLIGYGLISLYVCIFSGPRCLVHNRFFAAIGGCIAGCMAMFASIGICSLTGIKFTTLHNKIAFIILCINADNQFVLSSTLTRVKKTHPHLSVPDRMGHMLSEGGTSLLICALADVIAMGVGAISMIPFVSSFFAYVSTAIMANYLFQMTFYVAVLALDQRRADSSRSAICCCIRHVKPSTTCCPHGLLSKFFEKYYGPLVTSIPFKVIAILLTVGMTVFFGYSLTSLDYHSEQKWWLQESTPAYKYLDAIDRYFSQKSLHTAIYIAHDDSFADKDKLLHLIHEMEVDEYTIPDSVQSWYSHYVEWLKTANVSSELVDPDTSFPVNRSSFYVMLHEFLEDEGSVYRKDIYFDRGEVVATAFHVSNVPFHHLREAVSGMEHLVDLAHETCHHCYAYTIEYLAIESYEHLREELLTSVILALLAIALVALVFLASPLLSIYITVNVAIVLVNVAGCIQVAGFTMDKLSVTVFIQAIGFCVDGSVHISEAFISSAGTKDGRIHQTLHHMGPSVFLGTTASLIALLPFVIGESYVSKVYFQLFYIVMAFCLYYALVFLPVVLSLIGPTAYLSAGQHDVCHDDHDDHDHEKGDEPTQNNGVPSITLSHDF